MPGARPAPRAWSRRPRAGGGSARGARNATSRRRGGGGAPPWAPAAARRAARGPPAPSIDDRQEDVARVLRVVIDGLGRADEVGVLPERPARVRVPVELREVRRRDLDADPMAAPEQ